MNDATLPRLNISDVSGDHFDVIVIGGGITGAGIALDAASRGLTTLVIDKGDFASATSSKSTKLVHGGLRYLQQLQFRVTLESVRERQVLSRLAPHMVWRLPFVIPTFSDERFKNLKLRVGLRLYDLMARERGKEAHKTLSRDEVLRRCPGVRSKHLTGGLFYHDCRTDDARHTLEVIKAAGRYGAKAVNYAEVTGFIKENGKIVGITVVDTLDRENRQEVKIFGAVVINATGVWTKKTSDLTGSASSTEVVPAKGIHVVLSKERLPIDCAMILPSPHDKRFCFAVPWYDAVLVGTTDTEYHGDIEKVRAEPDEIQYVLDSVNAMFPDAKVTSADISGTYAGLRPLVAKAGEKGATNKISRDFHLDQSADGLVTIAGGKLTTYPPMAEQAVDLAVKSLVGRQIPASCTESIMLGGWVNSGEISWLIDRFGHAAEELGIASDGAWYLPTAYGMDTKDVLALVEASPELAERISPAHPYIMAQVVYAVRAESARTIDDMVARRIRLTITDAQAALQAADSVSVVMGRELGWSEAERQKQVLNFKQQV